MNKSSRKYDILVWGATGFTGQLIVEYFARNGPNGLKLALGGRTKNKLDSLRSRVEGENCKCILSVIVASEEDSVSMSNMIKECKVVISTVGPYLLHGFSLLKECVNFGVDYCDLTGEPPFMKESIRRFHQKAEQNGTLILHACGYDSIPSDLGTLMVVNHIEKTFGKKCGFVECYQIIQGEAGASGGTIASAMAVGRSSWKELSLMDNYYLCNKKGNDKEDTFFPRYDKKERGWTIPFLMASVNIKVVHRSNEFLGYSDDFHYMERFAAMPVRSVIYLYLKMLLIALIVIFSPLQYFASHFLNKPGEGPTRHQMKNTTFRTKIVGETEDKTQRAIGIVEGYGDPGYSETSRMVAETALCLLLERDKIPGKRGGVLTPAVGLGVHLINRLQKAGMKFEVIQ